MLLLLSKSSWCNFCYILHAKKAGMKKKKKKKLEARLRVIEENLQILI